MLESNKGNFYFCKHFYKNVILCLIGGMAGNKGIERNFSKNQ